jgi:hypothetical protein
MLSAVALVDLWNEIEAGLGEEWAEARLKLRLAKPETAARATALLGPLAPSRSGDEIALHVARGPGLLGRALGRLDREQIKATLELVGSTAREPAVAAEAVAPPPTLAEAWDAQLATLPPDWSDLLVELELRSSDYLSRASLRMTPLNARRTAAGRPALQFRVARTYGYGAAPEMTRRCMERCDEDSIRGELRVLRVLSGTFPVHTQGPVWHIAGRTV